MSTMERITYADLYACWERGQWRATEIDFSADREHWHGAFSALERRAALWNYSLFFHGEDAVADDLAPFIDAAPREEQKYFLTTQQSDEARHAVFFHRFMDEVAGRGDGTIAGALRATEPELTWGFRKTFAMLHEVTDALRRDRSRAALARAVTMYHFIVEATLAQPGGTNTAMEIGKTSRSRSATAAGTSSGSSRARSCRSLTPKPMWRCSSRETLAIPSLNPGRILRLSR